MLIAGDLKSTPLQRMRNQIMQGKDSIPPGIMQELTVRGELSISYPSPTFYGFIFEELKLFG